jgi:lipopolysaccharide export system protein LptC
LKSWARPLGYLAVLAIVTIAYILGRAASPDDTADTAAGTPPDPGYAARDAVVIETGYDGRERYRLNAKVIRQQSEFGVIDLEQLEMDYHPDAQGSVPGEAPAVGKSAAETWHLKSDRGQVRADGDDIALSGNVRVIGPAPGAAGPLELTTESLRVNTPTEFIETDQPVKLRWSGNELNAVGLEADLKAGNVRLKSAVHGSSAR